MATRTLHGTRAEVNQQLGELKTSPVATAMKSAFDALPAQADHEGDVQVSCQDGADSVSAFVSVQARVQLPPK